MPADRPVRTTRQPGLDDRFAVPLRGVDVGRDTRCAHYGGPRDVIAIRFACCDTYYPCAECHAETADHEPTVWPRERFDEAAVLCGVCRTALSVMAYLDAGHVCPACGAPFNPGCAAHHNRYFETEGAAPDAPPERGGVAEEPA